MGIKERLVEFIDSKLPRKETKSFKGSVLYYDYVEDCGQNDEKFQAILKYIYGVKGGYSDNKYNRGEKTEFGITQKNIRHMGYL